MSILSELISEYEKSGGAGEFISVAYLTKPEDFFDKNEFIPRFANSFHSSVELLGKRYWSLKTK